LREGSAADFLDKLKEFDPIYDKIKIKKKPNHVLRYIGELSGDLQMTKEFWKSFPYLGYRLEA
jgi:hypothetical protein